MRRTIRCLLIVLSSIFCRGISASSVKNEMGGVPSPLPYPEAFSISFVTNITRADSTESTDYPIRGTLFYDWKNSKSQRIDHAAGSYECQHFYQTPGPCLLIFRPDEGMYRILPNNVGGGENENNESDCCLDLPQVGAPPPNWAVLANPTYNGIVHDERSGRLAQEWKFDRLNPPFNLGHDAKQGVRFETIEYHSIRHVANSEHFDPLLFTFPGKAEGRQDFHYQLDTLEIREQDSYLFQLPAGCAQRLCKTTARRDH